MGLANQVVQLAVPASVAAGAAQAVGPFTLHGGMLVVSGTFVATMQIQVSVDGGVTSANARAFSGALVGNITTIDSAVLAGDATHVRMNCSAYTSGQPIATLMFPQIPARADKRLAP
jgi:hypothetical protein